MRRLAVALLVAGLALTGCFSGGGEGDAPGTARLRVGLAFPPAAGLSPYGDDATLGTRLGITETLVTLQPTGGPAPALATAWTQVAPTSWRVTLRPGVRFHDGTPLTPDAVAGSLTAASRANPVPRALSDVTLTARPDGADAVVLTTAAPDPVLIQRLASPELAILAPTAFADPARPSPRNAGTGPFVLADLTGAGAARLEAFGGYWGGGPAAPGVDVRFLSDSSARANALRAGELDIVEAIPVAQVPAITAPARVISVPLPRSVSTYLDQRSPVFADPGVRAAARQAIAGVDVAATVFEGQADRAAGLFGPASPWSANRPPRAAAPAGPVAPGTRIRFATYSDRAELPATATVLAEALRRAGFTVDLTVQEYAALEPQLFTGAFDAVLQSRSQLLDTGDPVGYLASDIGCRGGNNLARYCDPATDALIARAGAQTDVAARQRGALDAEARVLGADAIVPSVTERTRVGVGPGVVAVAEDPQENYLVTSRTARG